MFADFVLSDKRTEVLPHMPPDQCKFFTAVYRMDTQMVDQDPYRTYSSSDALTRASQSHSYLHPLHRQCLQS
ncbi:hypothetical protein DFH29DRAFT_961862 [Suillus ampliporus]|nr:hypothetical protein DFH29DRAFT_961862 [Suillus ampliporus]